VRDSGATAYVYIGEICRYLLNRPPEPTDGQHRVRRVIGNGLRPEIWDEFVERFRPGRVFEFYGATEGNVNMINLTGRRGSVGRIPPILDNTLLVRFDPATQEPMRDENGRCIACKPGEAGELLGRINTGLVSQRFDGYLDSDATEKKILRDVRQPGDAYFRSGDLLRKDRWGYYYFVDRVGDTFRWKGENVSTNEVGPCSSATRRSRSPTSTACASSAPTDAPAWLRSCSTMEPTSTGPACTPTSSASCRTTPGRLSCACPITSP